MCLKCFPTVCYQTQKLIFARVPTQNQHPSLSLLPKPFDRPPVCGYPCKMNNPLCLCLRNPWTVPLSPCTHAKSISFSIFGCKIAVTSPRPLSPSFPPPFRFDRGSIRAKTLAEVYYQTSLKSAVFVGGGAHRPALSLSRPRARGWRPRPVWHPWRRPGGLDPSRAPLRRACP